MNRNLFAYVCSSKAAQSSGDGILHGTRVAIQPNLCVRGRPTEAGSAALENYVALEDATAVERLRKEGALLIGGARMSELGFGLVGNTASQVMKEGDCDVALMTDTMGELRYSACLAGAFGFKPSFGICSRLGLIGLVPSMECIGVMARSPKDAAGIMGAISGPDEQDFSMLAEGFPDFSKFEGAEEKKAVLGVVRECLDLLPPEESGAFQNTLSQIREKGWEIREMSLPDFPLFRTVHQVVGSVEASSAAGKYDSVRYGHRAEGTENWNEMYLKSREESFGTLVKSYIFQGAWFQFKDYGAFKDACRIRRRLVDQTKDLFKEADVIILPARRRDRDAYKAETVSEVYDAFALTLPANVTGMPAACLSGLVKIDDFDSGLQIMGPHLEDVKVLNCAAKLMKSWKGDQ